MCDYHYLCFLETVLICLFSVTLVQPETVINLDQNLVNPINQNNNQNMVMVDRNYERQQAKFGGDIEMNAMPISQNGKIFWILV